MKIVLETTLGGLLRELPGKLDWEKRNEQKGTCRFRESYLLGNIQKEKR